MSKRHDVVLVSFLVTLNIFHTIFQCYDFLFSSTLFSSVEFEQLNVCWVNSNSLPKYRVACTDTNLQAGSVTSKRKLIDGTKSRKLKRTGSLQLRTYRVTDQGNRCHSFIKRNLQHSPDLLKKTKQLTFILLFVSRFQVIFSYFIKRLCFLYINFRSSHQWCSIKKGVLKKFAKFTGKHLCQSLFLIKLQACNYGTSIFL